MTEKHHAAGNCPIVPAIAREMQDNFDNSVTLGNREIEAEGFLRLTTEEFCRNPIEIIKRVMLRGDRILLQQAGEDVGAIVLDSEFHKLDDLMFQIKPSQFGPEEEEYYEDETAIHCIYPEELVGDIDNILADVKEFDELFGVLPTRDMGEDVDIFMPGVILMSADRFWVPDYLIAEGRAIVEE